MKWSELAARSDLVGGDIETQEDGAVYRGPIKAVKQDGNFLVIETEWLAKMTPGQAEWHAYNPPHGYAMRIGSSAPPPQDIGQGRILFTLRMCGICTIFLKGGSKLDPAKVTGLDLKSPSTDTRQV